jgi:anti-sigma factor (TIGR02949 family)
MTDCGCDKAKAELEEYLHSELSAQDLQDVSDHLANCEDCSAEHFVGVTLTMRVRSACQETAPAELKAAVLAAIEST